jgi:tripeptide aminopeptidase
MLKNYYNALLERFLRYVQIDTQSDPESTTYPTTSKQFDLLRVLKSECESLGLSNVELDKYGYMTATLPSNTDKATKTVGFMAHVDTSPEISGAGVKPIIHKNYQGQDIVLPDRADTVIRFKDTPELAEQIGNDIVTASGTTLLGADNKSGVAAIMTAMQYLLDHPEVKHGDIRIAFTPDEEVGGGTTYFDIQKFNAYCAYTIDSSTLGMLDTETFSADAMNITFEGFNTHPGDAYHTMINAIKLAADFLARLPKDTLSPETTRGREGFVHPTDVKGGVDATTVQFILRDFVEEKLTEKKDLLLKLAQETVDAYPGSKYTYEHRVQYRNMREVLDQFPDVVNNAAQAIRDAGLTLREESVRGGTDGSELSRKGMPTPNIFAGEHNYHSRYEWVSVQDMLKSAEVIVRLAEIWGK